MVFGALMALLIGVSLGLLGGGGSILTVPILLYVFHLPAREAIATSLLVVGTTSLAAVVPHARAGRVQWRTGAIFGATSMVGAFVAGRLAKHIPAAMLLLAFGGMMVITAIAMMRGKKSPEGVDEVAPKPLPVAKIVAEGLAVGGVTGLVGAGGGFLVVPALVLLGGLPMPVAVGTSLLVIAMKSFAGFAGYLSSVAVPWNVAGVVVAAAVAGAAMSALPGCEAPVAQANPQPQRRPAGGARTPTVYLPHGGGPWPFVELGFGTPGEKEALLTYLRSVRSLTPTPPRALLVVSAHWEEEVATLMTAARPPLLFDYYGFPEESYRLTWPAPGAPACSCMTLGRASRSGWKFIASSDTKPHSRRVVAGPWP